MRTVTTFQWKRRNYYGYYGSFPNEYLPQVKELVCEDIYPFYSLLRRGTITSLHCEDSEGSLSGVPSQGSASLVHLRTSRADLILSSIEQDPSSYRNLQYLAYFSVNLDVVSATLPDLSPY